MGLCEVFSVDPANGHWDHEILPNGTITGPRPRVWRTRAYVCTGIPPFIETDLVGESSFVPFKPGNYDQLEMESVAAASMMQGPSCRNHNSSWSLSEFTMEDIWMLPDDGRLKLATYGYSIDGWKDEIDLWGYFRGRNPDRATLSAELGDDIHRALCWKESTWRQFVGRGVPLTNGTGDWGLMQLRQIGPILKWDWVANVHAGKQILATKMREGRTYLSTHGNFTDDMLMREGIQRYNGGRHYMWDSNKGEWSVNPHMGANPDYVPEFIRILEARPWESP